LNGQTRNGVVTPCIVSIANFYYAVKRRYIYINQHLFYLENRFLLINLHNNLFFGTI